MRGSSPLLEVPNAPSASLASLEVPNAAPMSPEFSNSDSPGDLEEEHKPGWLKLIDEGTPIKVWHPQIKRWFRCDIEDKQFIDGEWVMFTEFGQFCQCAIRPLRWRPKGGGAPGVNHAMGWSASSLSLT